MVRKCTITCVKLWLTIVLSGVQNHRLTFYFKGGFFKVCEGSLPFHNTGPKFMLPYLQNSFINVKAALLIWRHHLSIWLVMKWEGKCSNWEKIVIGNNFFCLPLAVAALKIRNLLGPVGLLTRDKAIDFRLSLKEYTTRNCRQFRQP